MGDPAWAPFWEAVQDRDVAVFMHPEGPKCDWFQRYGFWNSLGVSFEEAKFLASMIFDGMLDRFPRLKIVVTHAGGYFPHYLARADHAYQVRPESRTMARPPSAYLDTLYFDSLVYTDDTLSRLLSVAGPAHVLLGTDYPFDMGVTDPVERAAAAGLPAADLTAILSGNAAALFGIS